MNNGNGQTSGELEELLTVEELASKLKVAPSWIYSQTRRRTRNRLPGFRLGKYWRFRESEVLRWLEEQRSGFAGV